MQPTKEQLKTKFAVIYHNFTAEELENPKTAASIELALKNIKDALTATEEGK